MDGISSPATHPMQLPGRQYRPDATEPRTAAPPGGPETRITSDAGLWRALARTVGETQTGTVDVYHQMLTKYTSFYKEVTEFKARLRTYIEAGSDQNHIAADIGKINYELRALRQRWRDTTVFGPATLKQVQRWSGEWGLPIAGYASANEARVVIDTSPLDAMIEATGKVDKTYSYYNLIAPDDASQKANWLAAEHHAWDTAMGEQHRQIETKVNTLAEQNNHALSTFNNLTKTLSASINALFESLVSYLRALA